MAIVYYHAPQSSAVRTSWAIEELGLRCERRLMDLAAKDTWAARCQARPAHRRALG
jgi:hypothetical protein